MVDDAAAEAEADRADPASAFGMCFQPVRRGEEIGPHLGIVDLAEHLPALLIVARVAAERRDSVGRERDIALDSEPARHVFDIGIEAAVLVHDQDGRQFSGRIRGPHQIALDASVALRRRHRDGLGLDATVILRDLDRPGVVRLEHLEQRLCGHAADGKLLRPVEERAAVDATMHVFIEQVEKFLREIRCFLSFHGSYSLLGWVVATRQKMQLLRLVLVLRRQAAGRTAAPARPAWFETRTQEGALLTMRPGAF